MIISIHFDTDGYQEISEECTNPSKITIGPKEDIRFLILTASNITIVVEVSKHTTSTNSDIS